MRIEISFYSENRIIIPWQYLDFLRGIFYQALNLGIPRLAKEIHNNGFLIEGKKYKLATFSLLYPERYEKCSDGLSVQGHITWWVSSPIEPLINALSLGLLNHPTVRFGNDWLKVLHVRELKTPKFSESMTFTTLSPICVSTGERSDSGQFVKRFLSPPSNASISDSDDFVRILSENLERKAKIIFGQDYSCNRALLLEPLSTSKSKLLKIKDTDVRAWMMSGRISGPAELLQLAYDAGLGERNTQGFGMIDLQNPIWRS